MSCTGCAEAAALGMARCLPHARELAGRRDEPSAERRRWLVRRFAVSAATGAADLAFPPERTGPGKRPPAGVSSPKPTMILRPLSGTWAGSSDVRHAIPQQSCGAPEAEASEAPELKLG
jgi:hypothetical protein